MSTHCDRCDRWFKNYDAHIHNSSFHNICDDCDCDFPSWLGLKEHWVQSRRHDYCQQCNKHFYDREDLLDHYDQCHYYCRKCNLVFVKDYGLQEHYRQSPNHHFCQRCNRDFISASNLQSHMNSSVHRPKDVACPFKRCGMKFVSRSALVLHLEGGACRSGIDRNTVDRYVRKYDKTNIITDPSRLLTGYDSSEEVQYIATAAAWNGSGFECYLCHGTYRSLSALNQHLASPRHQDKVYICPDSNCRCRFTTLSALCQHIESEKCGVSKFRLVQSTMDSVLGQMGRLTM